MKKYISIIALSGLVLSSCSDFLDVQSEGNPTTNAYFTNDQQAIDAIDGLYAPIHQETGFGRELFWEQGAACDIVWGRTRGYNTLATFAYTGDESPISDTFNMFYQNMSRSNWIIKQLLNKKKTTQLTDVETRSLGEAYFMRGMAHFWIAYRYGTDEQGVPFVRYEDFEGDYDNSIPPQLASVTDNYQAIIDDMDQAISYLPKFEEYSDDDKGRAHQAAAVAYKAKVYAYWATWDEGKWNDVIAMVNELENTYGRDLAPTFAEIFSSDFADFWNAEYIWSIPSTGGSTGGGVEFPGIVLENKGWGIYNGWGQLKPSYDIYEEMAKDGAGNDRLVRSILEYNQEFEFFGEKRRFFSVSDLEAGFQINKYMDPFKHKDATNGGYVNTNGDWPTARINFPLIRFAEMLLFRAEAYLMTGKPELAKADLNRIRVRSNLQPLEGTPTMKDLYHERRCELAFEYTDHLFDLKRWHRSSNAEIKELAAKELNAHPRVRIYEDRSNPESTFTIGDYEDYKEKKTYEDYMMVFPYPSNQITKSNGKLKQNKGY
ncbi:RagB/SusD family nutrient uptake outer membrane protein [Phocaeicola barnesiae]|uniref:RagB/SusD family nutrient uptake outer membrane protein n=1 Tax=Phocaeicola barnesiae TaxID=376804 RepID=UPI00242BF7D5|nr:RagB/SusD family nutrient uptake outer membrane protein [Phocaeicola barnesiae]